MTVPVAPTSSARERILDAAYELFYREGFRAVGVDTIIARAGVAKMTLYKHFRSKDDLILAFLARRDELWRRWFTAAVEGRAETARGRLLAIFEALEEWFASDDFRGCAFINASLELASHEHPARRAALEHKQCIRSYVRQLAAEAGVCDPDSLSEQLMLLIEGAIVTAVMEGGAAPARRARRAAAVLLAAASSD